MFSYSIAMQIFNINPVKDTPHSELLFSTELNQKTSNSGHSNLFHITESTNTVIPVCRIFQCQNQILMKALLLRQFYIFKLQIHL